MTLPILDTRVTYPAGELTSTSQVLHLEEMADGRLAILLDSTSCHPVDAGWPDQGPDNAVLRRGSDEIGTDEIGTDEIRISDCIVGATDGHVLHVGREIPVAKGTEGWAFVVVHIVEQSAAAALSTPLAEGDTVDVVVEAEHRRLISAGHTGCHAASLALNLAVADRWKKDVRLDSLGTPDFDGIAIDVSQIRENGSTDTYRLGKSLRKKGFVTEGLTAESSAEPSAELAAIESAVNATLAGWVAADAAVHIDSDGPLLTDRRYWVCELPEGTVRIPCGGTHLRRLGDLSTASVSLSVADIDGTLVLTMNTTVSADIAESAEAEAR